MAKLIEMLKLGGVYVGFNSTQKEDSLDEILSYFCEKGKFAKAYKNKLKEAILERESNGSTGIGEGVALPHCRIGKDDEAILFISLAKTQVDFDSIDAKPVKVVFLAILPKSNTEIHTNALKAIAGLMRNERFSKYIKEATTIQEVVEIIEDYEKELEG